MATKILVVGPVRGDLLRSFSKIQKAEAKQGFSFALIVGDVFDHDNTNEDSASQLLRLLDNQIAIPIPTYFSVGDHALPPSVQQKLELSGEVCDNLIFLGRKGTLTTADGIKIVYLGGRQVRSEDNLTTIIGNYEPLFLEHEARALHGSHSAHILLTNQWPTGIQNASAKPFPDNISLNLLTNLSTTSIANLCATLKPRYHFSTSPSSTTAWTREPFLWSASYSDDALAERYVTRFQALSGSTGSKASDWISAFQIDLTRLPSIEGVQKASPFELNKRKQNFGDRPPSYGMTNTFSGNRGSTRKRRRYDPNAECFMCLGKPQFDQAMVISIGDESFLTSLRGPLPLKDTFPQLASSGNLMIIPLYHAADENAHGLRTDVEIRREFQEMSRYKHAIHHCLNKRADSRLGCIVWETNRTGIRHFHWQLLACPAELVDRGLVEAAFKVAAEKSNLQPFQQCPAAELLPSGKRSDYFRVWIWSPNIKSHDSSASANSKTHSPVEAADCIAAGDEEPLSYETPPLGSSEISLFFDLPPDQKGFNVQFGRYVMSGLLQLEHRADWKTIQDEQGSEAKDATDWKQDFGEFDFAMA